MIALKASVINLKSVGQVIWWAAGVGCGARSAFRLKEKGYLRKCYRAVSCKALLCCCTRGALGLTVMVYQPQTGQRTKQLDMQEQKTNRLQPRALRPFFVGTTQIQALQPR